MTEKARTSETSAERGQLVLHPPKRYSIEDGQCECPDCGEWFKQYTSHDCEFDEYWEWLARQT